MYLRSSWGWSSLTRCCSPSYRTTISYPVFSLRKKSWDTCDIFAPCAMGAVLNMDNVHHLKCKLIAGAANNVLMDDATGDALEELGILYMPDFIINAGGIINCGMEVTEKEYSADVVNQKVDAIYDTSLEIVATAREKGIGTYQAANEYAMGVIEAKKQNILI